MVLKKTCLTADGNRAQWRAVDAHAATRRGDTRQSKKGDTRRCWRASRFEMRARSSHQKAAMLRKPRWINCFAVRADCRTTSFVATGAQWNANDAAKFAAHEAPRHTGKNAHFRTGHPTLATILGGATDGPTSATNVAHKLDVPPKPSSPVTARSHGRTSLARSAFFVLGRKISRQGAMQI